MCSYLFILFVLKITDRIRVDQTLAVKLNLIAVIELLIIPHGPTSGSNFAFLSLMLKEQYVRNLIIKWPWYFNRIYPVLREPQSRGVFRPTG